MAAQIEAGTLVAAMAIGARGGQFNPRSETDTRHWLYLMFPELDIETLEAAVRCRDLVATALERHLGLLVPKASAA